MPALYPTDACAQHAVLEQAPVANVGQLRRRVLPAGPQACHTASDEPRAIKQSHLCQSRNASCARGPKRRTGPSAANKKCLPQPLPGWLRKWAGRGFPGDILGERHTDGLHPRADIWRSPRQAVTFQAKWRRQH